MDLAEVIRIKYCPGDLSAPCARKNDPAFLDVVYVNPSAVADLHVHYWPAGMTHWDFEPGHTYNLDIAILSDGVSRRCDFEFVWTGDANTSSCRLITNGVLSRPIVGITQSDCSADVKAIVNDAVRLLRENPGLNNFPLQALQMAGVGNLKTEAEFSEVRERITQHGFTPPLVGLESIYRIGNQTEPRWLEVIKWANRKNISVSSPDVLMDCVDNYSKQLS